MTNEEFESDWVIAWREWLMYCNNIYSQNLSMYREIWDYTLRIFHDLSAKMNESMFSGGHSDKLWHAYGVKKD